MAITTRKTAVARSGLEVRRAAAGLAVAILVICTFNSLLWINRPFPGFFVWPNLFVPAVGGPDWTGYTAGVPYESRLTTVDDEPLESADDGLPGDPRRGARRDEIDLHVRSRPIRRSRSSWSSPIMRLGAADYLWSLGTYIVIGSLLTLLGFAVYLIRPDRPGARAMLVASATWGLYLVTSADMVGPAWFQPLYLMLRAIAPVALVHLALSFPVQRQHPAPPSAGCCRPCMPAPPRRRRRRHPRLRPVVRRLHRRSATSTPRR